MTGDLDEVLQQYGVEPGYWDDRDMKPFPESLGDPPSDSDWVALEDCPLGSGNELDADVSLRLSDYWAGREEWRESGEALLSSGMWSSPEANAASIMVAVDEIVTWHLGSDDELDRNRVKACKQAVTNAPNPLAQAEVGLLLLEFADVPEKPRYSANDSYREFHVYHDAYDEERSVWTEDDYVERWSLGRGLIARGISHPLDSARAQLRKEVLREAVRAFGRAQTADMPALARLLCLDGLRCTFYELRDSDGIQAVCNHALDFLAEIDCGREFLPGFKNGLTVVRAWERIKTENGLEIAENRLRALPGIHWDRLRDATRYRLCQAEALMAVIPSIRGMSYDSPYMEYYCALETQLRAGLGNHLRDLVTTRWSTLKFPRGAIRGGKPKPPYEWDAPSFQEFLGYQENRGAILRTLKSAQTDQSLVEFILDVLPEDIDQVCAPRNIGPGHGATKPQHVSIQVIQRVRRILLNPEQEGVIAKLAQLPRQR
jgi:hypothetical protein